MYVALGKLCPKFAEIFVNFGLQLNTFMPVGILPKCYIFRRKLLLFE